jgi:hypothetical protein
MRTRTPSKKALGNRRDTKPPMQTTVTLDFTVTFASGVKVDADELLETVPDAIMEHDDHNRLLPGVPKPPGDERVVGTGIKIVKVEQAVDAIWRIKQTPFEPPESWDDTRQECSADIDMSGAIDQAIEELREIQARLWDRYEAMMKANRAWYWRVSAGGEHCHREGESGPRYGRRQTGHKALTGLL